MRKSLVLLLALTLVVGLSLAAQAIPKVIINDVQILGKSTTVAPGREFPTDTITVRAWIKNEGDEAGRVEKVTLSLIHPFSGSPTTWTDSSPYDLSAGNTRTYSRDFTIYVDPARIPNPNYTAKAELTTSRRVSKTRNQLFVTFTAPPVTARPVGR